MVGRGLLVSVHVGLLHHILSLYYPQIKIDKIGVQWSGSLGVGVTSCLLPMSNVPSSAEQLRDGTWLMVESRILKDGMTVKENYGPSLDRLQVCSILLSFGGRDGASASSQSQHVTAVLIVVFFRLALVLVSREDVMVLYTFILMVKIKVLQLLMSLGYVILSKHL